MKDSPNTIRSAPASTAFGTSVSNLSIVASRSRNTGAACTAAARNFGYVSPGMMTLPPRLYANVLASLRIQVPAPGFLHAAHSDTKAEGNDYYRIPETVVDVARRNHQTERHGRQQSSYPTHPRMVRD